MTATTPTLATLAAALLKSAEGSDVEASIVLSTDMLTLALAELRERHGRHVTGCTVIALGAVADALANAVTAGKPEKHIAGAVTERHRRALDAAHRAAERMKAKTRPAAPAGQQTRRPAHQAAPAA